ncbi:hypothetical protein [Paraburkholderia humisilvae]|uniref:Type III secretion protein HrpB7 n=1 Tax=Paraburkholderia humisilvae TaxID=627669 RepID=A0A6J5F3G9_9BURK|nr:hypothetical protein [Paraburkholderia humisilvae]CAB3772207.1 hypothetical protein LMG29542_06828 [Paraburkholderia humisilvae]
MQTRLRAWRTILSVKERAQSRAQTELDARRQELAAQVQATAQAHGEQQTQAAQRADAQRELADLLAEPAALAPERYLRHRHHLKTCDERVQAADSALSAAVLKEQDCRSRLGAAQRQLAALDASLAACRKLYQKQLDQLAAREEALADDEAGEVAAARRHRAMAAARAQDDAAQAFEGV